LSQSWPGKGQRKPGSDYGVTVNGDLKKTLNVQRSTFNIQFRKPRREALLISLL